MTTILTAAEMRALEQAAIASGEVTGLELMERAGRGVVEAILAEWPEIEQGARRAFGPKDEILREMVANHRQIATTGQVGGVT